MMLEPDGINVRDAVNATVALTERLPAMRSAWAMEKDPSRSFEKMCPEERKFELEQLLTIRLTFEPIVLLPKVKPLMVIENVDDALIAPPEMLKITELE